jgi:hypothetical protein
MLDSIILVLVMIVCHNAEKFLFQNCDVLAYSFYSLFKQHPYTPPTPTPSHPPPPPPKKNLKIKKKYM